MAKSKKKTAASGLLFAGLADADVEPLAPRVAAPAAQAPRAEAPLVPPEAWADDAKTATQIAATLAAAGLWVHDDDGTDAYGPSPKRYPPRRVVETAYARVPEATRIAIRASYPSPIVQAKEHGEARVLYPSPGLALPCGGYGALVPDGSMRIVCLTHREWKRGRAGEVRGYVDREGCHAVTTLVAGVRRIVDEEAVDESAARAMAAAARDERAIHVARAALLGLFAARVTAEGYETAPGAPVSREAHERLLACAARLTAAIGRGLARTSETEAVRRRRAEFRDLYASLPAPKKVTDAKPLAYWQTKRWPWEEQAA